MSSLLKSVSSRLCSRPSPRREGARRYGFVGIIACILVSGACDDPAFHEGGPASIAAPAHDPVPQLPPPKGCKGCKPWDLLCPYQLPTPWC